MLYMLRDYWLLMRPRIVALVLFTILMSALIIAQSPPAWPMLLHGLAGNALVIIGAIALNQCWEYRTDAQMARTAARPLPAGRLSLCHVVWFAMIISSGGEVYLWTQVNRTTAVLAAISWLIYVGVYTPIKPLTMLQTPIGAVAGAMPTLLGAAMVGTPWTRTATILFATVYFWQFPHAMAIAWLYRQQFSAAKLRLATVVDPTGRLAGWLAVLGAAVLVPISLVLEYKTISLIAGVIYLLAAVGFLCQTTDLSARRLLKVSVIYLVVLLFTLTVLF